MFYVYVLLSLKNNRFYVGRTNDLKKRIQEHNQGLNSSTKPYRPWKLIYYEASLEQTDSIRRERYLKTTQGHRLLQRRLKDYLYQKQAV
jgi:putative endonuclease